MCQFPSLKANPQVATAAAVVNCNSWPGAGIEVIFAGYRAERQTVRVVTMTNDFLEPARGIGRTGLKPTDDGHWHNAGRIQCRRQIAVAHVNRAEPAINGYAVRIGAEANIRWTGHTRGSARLINAVPSGAGAAVICGDRERGAGIPRVDRSNWIIHAEIKQRRVREDGVGVIGAIGRVGAAGGLIVVNNARKWKDIGINGHLIKDSLERIAIIDRHVGSASNHQWRLLWIRHKRYVRRTSLSRDSPLGRHFET